MSLLPNHTPSIKTPESPEEKAAIIQSYKDNLKRIPCKLFAHGAGKCPFGNSCFYAHLVINQETGAYEQAAPEVLRTRVGAEGDTSVVGEVKISDFFR